MSEETVAAEKAAVVIPAKFEKLVAEIEQMSVLDLSELVSILEEKFGVSAAAPMMMAAMPGAAGAADGGAAEKTSFDVELTSGGDAKINVIKVVKTVLGLGLKEAKDMVDGAPAVLKAGASKEEAEDLKKQIEEAGGTVTLK